MNSEIFDKELSSLPEVIKSQNIKETHLEIRTTAGATDSCDREGILNSTLKVCLLVCML